MLETHLVLKYISMTPSPITETEHAKKRRNVGLSCLGNKAWKALYSTHTHKRQFQGSMTKIYNIYCPRDFRRSFIQ